jgi:hypothetical protein
MKVSSTSTTSVLAAVERFGDSVAWYDEWAALIPLLETMQMAECQRCRELQTELIKQELEHSNDNIDWWASLAAKDVIIDEWSAKASELETKAVT